MKHFIAFVSGWCFIAAALVFSLQTTAFDREYYHTWYENSSLPETVDASLEDIEASMDLMLDYLTGERADLDGTIVWNGQEQETYNEKEKAHMKDVRDLYHHALLAGMICLVLFILISAFYLIRWRKNGLWWLAIGMRDAGACFLILLVFLGFWALTNFSDFWVHFHEVFFTNDLWLLNPATDFMINICPENLFSGLIVRVAIRFSVFFVPVFILSVLYSFRKIYQE